MAFNATNFQLNLALNHLPPAPVHWTLGDDALEARAFDVHRRHREQPSRTLEWEGDAYIGLVATEYLLRRFPTLHVEHLTSIKVEMIQNRTLRCLALHLGFVARINNQGAHVQLTQKQKVDCFEAYIGAWRVRAWDSKEPRVDAACRIFCERIFNATVFSDRDQFVEFLLGKFYPPHLRIAPIHVRATTMPTETAIPRPIRPIPTGPRQSANVPGQLTNAIGGPGTHLTTISSADLTTCICTFDSRALHTDMGMEKRIRNLEQALKQAKSAMDELEAGDCGEVEEMIMPTEEDIT